MDINNIIDWPEGMVHGLHRVDGAAATGARNRPRGNLYYWCESELLGRYWPEDKTTPVKCYEYLSDIDIYQHRMLFRKACIYAS